MVHSPPCAARIDVHRVAPAGSVKMWQAPILLMQHQEYTLSFWAKGSGVLPLHLYGDGCPNSLCWGPHPFRLRPDWQHYETSFRSRGTAAVGLDFFVGQPGSLWLDDVSLREGDSALFRRDFENGLVLLNYTTQEQKVPLETIYHRLLLPGSDVFDGAPVRSETIPPSDARILLRDPPSALELPPPRPQLLGNRPNPFNPGTEISFTLATPGHVRLAVVDVKGRLVRVLLDANFPAENGRMVWDGRDSTGHPVSSGVYLCELIAAGERHFRKMVLLR